MAGLGPILPTWEGIIVGQQQKQFWNQWLKRNNLACCMCWFVEFGVPKNLPTVMPSCTPPSLLHSHFRQSALGWVWFGVTLNWSAERCGAERRMQPRFRQNGPFCQNLGCGHLQQWNMSKKTLVFIVVSKIIIFNMMCYWKLFKWRF